MSWRAARAGSQTPKQRTPISPRQPPQVEEDDDVALEETRDAQDVLEAVLPAGLGAAPVDLVRSFHAALAHIVREDEGRVLELEA